LLKKCLFINDFYADRESKATMFMSQHNAAIIYTLNSNINPYMI